MPSVITPRTLTRPLADWPGYQLVVREPLQLDCGVDFGPFTIAYQTYGKLNADRSNAVLICHALTGDQYVADPHPITGHPGWWSTIAGPGQVLDTNRYFLICANVLGGCMGSDRPQGHRPGDRQAFWALSFPLITDCATWCGRRSGSSSIIGIDTAVLRDRRLHGRHAGARVGRELSGNVFAAVMPVAQRGAALGADWCDGQYLDAGRRYPARGLAVARMAAHITYLSEAARVTASSAAICKTGKP